MVGKNNDIITWIFYGLLGLGALYLGGKLITKPSTVAISPVTSKPSDPGYYDNVDVPITMIQSPFDTANSISGKFNYSDVSNAMFGNSAPKKAGCGCGH